MPLRLRECRQLAHMSQEKAAEVLGVSGRTISNYERGKRYPDSRVLNAMADLYGVSADQLMGRKPLVAND